MEIPLNEKLEREFREGAMRVKGYRRGAFKEAMEDAIRLWLDANKKRIAEETEGKEDA